MASRKKKEISRRACAAIFATSALCGSSPVSAQAQNLAKLESIDILESARAGISQDLLASFETGGFENGIARGRIEAFHRHEDERTVAKHAHQSIDGINAQAIMDDDNLLQTLHNQLDAIKRATFSNELSGRSRIVRDFSHVASALARVPDYQSLLALIGNPNVKSVGRDRRIQPIANWPTSYSDISIVHSDVATEQTDTKARERKSS